MFWVGLLTGAAGMYGLLALGAWIVRRYDAKNPQIYSPSDFNDAAREYMANTKGKSL
jgi:hypothetical protein